LQYVTTYPTLHTSTVVIQPRKSDESVAHILPKISYKPMWKK